MNSRYSGAIEMTPSLNYKQIQQLESMNHSAPRSCEVKLEVDTVKEATEFGEILTHTASAIVPWANHEYRAYYVKHAVQEIVDAFPRVQFSGYLEGVLEDGSEHWRIVVDKDRVVQEITPTLTWPEV